MLDLWGRVRRSNGALELCPQLADAEEQGKCWNCLTWLLLDGGQPEAGKKLGPIRLISFWEVIQHFGTALGDWHNWLFWNRIFLVTDPTIRNIASSEPSRKQLAAHTA